MSEYLLMHHSVLISFIDVKYNETRDTVKRSASKAIDLFIIAATWLVLFKLSVNAVRSFGFTDCSVTCTP